MSVCYLYIVYYCSVVCVFLLGAAVYLFICFSNSPQTQEEDGLRIHLHSDGMGWTTKVYLNPQGITTI